MKIYQLIIYSKSKKSLIKSINFIIKKSIKLKLNTVKKVIKPQPSTKKMAVLKSPHVHKTAQEQFEFKTFITKINIYATQNFKFVTFIKEIKNVLFSDVKIKVQMYISKNTINNTQAFFNFKPKNLNLHSSNKKVNLIEVIRLLTSIELYGESNFKYYCLGSSGGRAQD